MTPAADAPPVIPVLEIGGSHATSARVRVDGWRIDRASVRRRSIDPAADAPTLLAAFAGCATDAGDAPHGGVWGVAIPAPFDYATGVAWFHGVGKFDALHGVDVGAALRRDVRPAPAAMRFLNDADAFVLGEWADGALAGCSRAAGITLGTGVGSGFLVDGALAHSGPGVPPDGRANELVVDGAPLEDWISARAIRRAYQARTGDGAADVALICRRAGGSEPAAAAVLRSAFGLLGRVLGPRLEEFGAARLVIGGSMAASWELVEPWFADGWRAAGAAPIDIVVSRRPDEAPLVGAAVHAAG